MINLTLALMLHGFKSKLPSVMLCLILLNKMFSLSFCPLSQEIISLNHFTHRFKQINPLSWYWHGLSVIAGSKDKPTTSVFLLAVLSVAFDTFHHKSLINYFDLTGPELGTYSLIFPITFFYYFCLGFLSFPLSQSVPQSVVLGPILFISDTLFSFLLYSLANLSLLMTSRCIP